MAIAFASCKKDDNPAPTDSGLIMIGEATLSGTNAKAMVYTDKMFETGYNTIYIKMVDTLDEKPLDGTLETMPMMEMGTMKHSAPHENRTSTMENGYYKTIVYFIMPGEATQWTLNFNFTNNTETGMGSLGVKVVSSKPARVISTIMPLDDSAKAFITLIDKGWEEGLNNFELVLHQRETMMSFPAIEDYTIEVEPEMPTMGHGSLNNVNPVHTSNGHYKGKINLSMSGLWLIHLKIYKNGILLSDDKSFEINL